MAKAPRAEVIANQVFIGCPWFRIRPKYEAAIDALKRKYPLSFIIVGRDEDQDAVELLEIIKGKLRSSTRAIFDATGGNANVSLELGFAEASGISRAIYISTRKNTKKSSGDRPIISDLAGKKQNHYKHNAGLEGLLATMAKNHPYTKRFEKFMSKSFKRASAGQRRRLRSLALKIVHAMDGRGTMRRDDIVQTMLAVDYSKTEVDQMIRRLHGAGLVRSIQGPHSTVTVT